MSYNILNKGVKFQGDTQGTIEDIVDTHSTQTINGLKTVTHLTGTHVRVTNDVVALGNISASVNISASAFYGDGSTLSNVGTVSFDGSTANGLLTYKDADEASVESSLTFDGSVLDFKGSSISGSGNISGSAFYGNGANLSSVNAATVTLASNGGLANSSGVLVDPTAATEETSAADGHFLLIHNGSALRKITCGRVAGLFDAAVETFTNQTQHRVVTVEGANSIDGEANLTFNGSVLTITGDVSGSQVISGSIGHFVTRVEATAISLGDASGIAGQGLTNNSGELDIQVSGAVKIASDKLGITGSFAGNGLLYEGGVDSISSIGIDLATSSGLQLSSGELSVNLNSLGTATPLFSADSVVFIDADDGSTKKSTFSNFVATMAGDGLVNNSGRFDINVSGAMALQSDKLVLSSSVAGNGLEVGAGDDQMVNTLSVKVSDFMSNGANNRILTAGDANSMNAETKFTFDDTTLILTGSSIFSGSATTFDTTEFVIQSATSEKPTIELKNTTPSDSNAGVLMNFFKQPSDNAGESDNNTLGGIKFLGLDSGNNSTIYGQMTVHSSDKTGGDEGGEFRFYVQAGGTGGTATLSEIFSIGGEDVGSGGGEPCEVVVNDAGIDCNFRVESDTNTTAFIIDGTNGHIGIGDDADSGALLTLSGSNDEYLFEAKQQGNGYPTAFLAGESHGTYPGLLYNRGKLANGGAISQGNLEGANGSHTRLTVRKASITDNSATNVVTITVPNANHAAAIRVFGLANFDNCAYSQVFSFQGTIGRTSGAPTDKAFSSVTTTENASVTPNFSIAVGGSSNTGANSATQTFTVQFTINTSDSASSNATFMIELINFNDSGVTMVAS